MQLLVRLLCVCCSLMVPLTMAKAVYPTRIFNESAYSSDHIPVVKRLQEVFGVSDRQRQRQLLSPPQYMLTLYASVADNSGVVKAPNPYGAKIIRSYTEKESSQRSYFTFNVSGMGISETLLEAELHLYVLRSEASLLREVRIYQILDSNWIEQPEKNRLIDIHYVNSSSEGWLIFRVTQAVQRHSFINSASNQLKFLVTGMSAAKQPVMVHVSRRRDRHSNRQPVLVLFNDDNGDSSSTSATQSDVVHESISSSDTRTNRNYEDRVFRNRRDLMMATETNEPFQKVATNHKRDHHHRRHLTNTNECHRQELYVEFESIGWSEWIIAPKGYNAYHCTGICSFPLGQSQKPTNHATVQSIVHEMNLAKSVAMPCCVPNRLLSLSLLYYDENDNVVLKQYGEMVADSCGCH
uniref:TGF-beta family profile domain-containing protein n=1 Tax=Daphnia galeata TaxID=27404 RepID=A0A8J2S641_9CRUS|nr:unnamed protein product [Daphnia galeata]